METKLKDIKEILNIVLTVVLIICALVIISLLMINFKNKTKKAKEANLGGSTLTYHLPEVVKLEKDDDIKKLYGEIRSRPIRAFPLVIEFASVVTIANNKMLFIPIIMNEPQLYGILSFGLIDPLKWDSKNQFSGCNVGRRSLWFMPVGTIMLYGILVDAQLQHKKIGLGYILVKRIDEITYDVLLEDYHGTILYAGRGELKKLNKDIGQGTLIPLKDQELVRRIYKPKWDIKPKDFMLFCDECN